MYTHPATAAGIASAAILKSMRCRNEERLLRPRVLDNCKKMVITTPPLPAAIAATYGPKSIKVAKVTAEEMEKAISGENKLLLVSISATSTNPTKTKISKSKGLLIINDSTNNNIPRKDMLQI